MEGFRKAEQGPSAEKRNDLQVVLAARYLDMGQSLAIREWVSEEGGRSLAETFAEYEKQQGTQMSYELTEENLEKIVTGMKLLRAEMAGDADTVV